LSKVAQTIDLILSHCQIGSQLFFSLLQDQLTVLERYFGSTTSRVVIFEAIEKALQSMISLKTLFIKINESEMRENFIRTVSHRNSPRSSKLNTGSYSRSECPTSKQFPGQFPPKYVSTATVRDIPPFYNPRQTLPQSERLQKKGSAPNVCLLFSRGNSLIIKNKELFSTYIKTIANMLVRIRKHFIFDCFLDMFLLEPNFLRLTSIFSKAIFDEILFIQEKIKASVESTGIMEEEAETFRDPAAARRIAILSSDELKTYQCAKNVGPSDTDRGVLQGAAGILPGDDQRAEDLRPPEQEQGAEELFEEEDLRRDAQAGRALRCPDGTHSLSQGVLWQYLVSLNETMIKLAKNNRFQNIKEADNLSVNFNLMFNLFHSIFELVWMAYSTKIKDSEFHAEPLSSGFIRLCYLSFVKIYSYISNKEIIQINAKVIKKLGEDKNPELNAQPKEDPHAAKQSFPILLSKMYLKVVLAIAQNRNEQVKNVFFQFRVMEFLYKELDLEFEITQIRDRFMKVRQNVRESVSREHSPKKPETAINPIRLRSPPNETEQSNNQTNLLQKTVTSPTAKAISIKLGIPKLSLGGPGKLSIPEKKEADESNKLSEKQVNSPKLNMKGLRLGLPQTQSPKQNMFALDFSKMAQKEKMSDGGKEQPQMGLKMKPLNLGGLKQTQPIPIEKEAPKALVQKVGKLDLRGVGHLPQHEQPEQLDESSSEVQIQSSTDREQVVETKQAIVPRINLGFGTANLPIEQAPAMNIGEGSPNTDSSSEEVLIMNPYATPPPPAISKRRLGLPSEDPAHHSAFENRVRTGKARKR
jgi:hypothetical protein